MDFRDRSLVLFFSSTAVGLVIVVSGGFLESAQQSFRHPGRVVEMDTRRPLQVDIKAWSQSDQTGNEGGCPRYGESAMDSTTSVPSDGRFLLRVASNKTTYTVTYCATGYYPRADRDVPNRDDGTPVVPDPVEIYPRKSDRRVYNQVVTSKVVALLNDLAYLETVSPEQFQIALRNLASDISKSSPSRAQVIQGVSNSVLRWK